MKERPILFNAEMVRAVLDGRKTQTRRICKLELSDSWASPGDEEHPRDEIKQYCPYGKPGDELWVRETHQYNWFWFQERGMAIDTHEPEVLYRANDIDCDIHGRREMKWRPSIFMPRWASRIQLRITDIRVERVQDIREEDVMEEGGPPDHESISIVSRDFGFKSWPISWFAQLWDAINLGRGYGWDKNPWVWVVEFEVK